MSHEFLLKWTDIWRFTILVAQHKMSHDTHVAHTVHTTTITTHFMLHIYVVPSRTTKFLSVWMHLNAEHSHGICTMQCCQMYSFGHKHMAFWYVVQSYGPMLGCTQNIRLFSIAVRWHCQKYSFLLLSFKNDFLKLAWLEVWIFFCHSQFWTEGAILVVTCWSYTGRRKCRSDNTKCQIIFTYEKIVTLFFEHR